MSHCANHIWSLEIHPSRLNKEAIIEAIAKEGNDEFFHGCQLALDPMVTFGIKQVKEKHDQDGPGLPWNTFVSIIGGFRNRTVTGNAARDTLEEMMALPLRPNGMVGIDVSLLKIYVAVLVKKQLTRL
jgi:hypothetical protein